MSTATMTQTDRRLTDVFLRESARLRNFIRARVADEDDADDLVMDVFAEFVAVQELLEPVRQASAWLFRVARNRIIDRYRRRRPTGAAAQSASAEPAEEVSLEDWLPSPQAGPDAAYARGILLEELVAALEELPPEQREVFVAHELEGASFRELAERTGVGVNTLLSRKRYAVLQLRERLRAIYEEYVAP